MQDVASVYRWIVDDVISKARPEFVHEGVDEATLHELRELWEKKLFESGCLNHEEDAPATTAAREGSTPAKQEAEAGGAEEVGAKRPRDEGDEGVKEAKTPEQPSGDGAAPTKSEGSGGKSKKSKSGGADGEDGDDGDSDIDSDDLDIGDTSEDDEFEDPSNLVLAQFEKVSRTKARWKCQLKAGIMHINGRDYIFNKAVGEFQF
mmetsp:Transcript_10012/g.25573  ORF Transcript_10012/g.25573 Transcript_10012/m.25573 type:complete len:205 (-) Transcript_10012:1293-1907(-)|eukprot:jgi/Tetstr1/435245/TSEL_024164.t1